MDCKKCASAIPENSSYCNHCGAKQNSTQTKKKKKKTRGNGTGSAYKMPNGTYKAEVVLGYTADGHKIRRTSSGHETKRAALDAIPSLRGPKSDIQPDITLAKLFERWIPFYEPRIKQPTMNCYKAAYKYFADLHYLRFIDITPDNLQACIDKCSKGKQTKRNMKALVSLLYTYAMQYDLTAKNFSQFLHVDADTSTSRGSFTEDEIKIIKRSAGIVPYADYILVLIYTGFRPTEMLTLTRSSYDPVNRAFTGGSKTKAGKNRIVTVSPAIQYIVDMRLAQPYEYLFPNEYGKPMSERYFRDTYYYLALDAMRIRKVVPYTCRHTFATLMKKVTAPPTDKQKLMGHTKFEQTVYYTDTDFASLHAITDNL